MKHFRVTLVVTLALAAGFATEASASNETGSCRSTQSCPR